MQRKKTIFSWSLLLASALLLTACGGGGGGSNSGGGDSGSSYKGNTAPAAISSEQDAQDAGTAATEAAYYGMAQQKANDNMPFSVAIDANSQANRRALIEATSLYLATLVPSSSDFPSAVDGDDDEVICSSGSVKFDGPTSPPSGSYKMKITFNNCITEDSTLNGVATIHFKSDGQLNKIVYNNFKVFDHETGETHTFNTTITFNYCGGSTICGVDFLGVFTGKNDITYQITNLSLEEDSSGGYTFATAKVCHETAGCMTIETTTALTYCPDTGYPSSGVIKVTSGAESATVTFSGCDKTTVSVTYAGGTTSIQF